MRIAYDVMIFLAIFFTPFWCVTMLAALGALLFPRWYEIVPVFVIVEFVYQGAPTVFMTQAPLIPLAVYALLLVFLIEWGRKRIRQRTL